MPDEIEAIRERWADLAWDLSTRTFGSLTTGAQISDASGHILIDLDEPTDDELALLRTAARAPGDIARLLARLDAAEADAAAFRQAIQAYRRECSTPPPFDDPDLRIAARQALFAALATDAGAALLAELDAARTLAEIARLSPSIADDVHLRIALEHYEAARSGKAGS